MSRWVIPRRTDEVLRFGDYGIHVWALQRQCQRLVKEPQSADGEFGRATQTAVVMLQGFLRVPNDGVCGRVTQSALGRHLTNAAEGLPKDLLFSTCSYESSCLLGAVNWMVPGGVDCGVTQRRILEESMGNDAVIESAFDAARAIARVASEGRDRYQHYRQQPGTKSSVELCWRVSVLQHNYPVLAQKIGQVGIAGLPSYYTTPQPWTQLTLPDGSKFYLKFPDGTEVKTPLQWGQRYALGAERHLEPGQAVKLVRDWTP